MNSRVAVYFSHFSSVKKSKCIIIKSFNTRNFSLLRDSSLTSINKNVNASHYFVCLNKNCKRYESTSNEPIMISGGTLSDSIFFKISDSQAVSYVQKSLLAVHDTTGLPWWATIALSTLILRGFITFPLAVYQAYISAKVENISLIDMPEIAKDIKEKTRRKAIESKWTSKEASFNYRRDLKAEWDKLIVAQNCHPVKGTLPVWFQIPTWICFSTALRNLSYMLPHRDTDAEIRFMELSVGGFMWLPNLALPDTTFILPIILGVSNLTIIEIQCLMRMREATRPQRYVTNFFRILSISLIPISATVPSCVCLYWTISSFLGLIQNLILMSNKVRSSFGIPDTPSTLERPYSHLAKEVALKLRLAQR